MIESFKYTIKVWLTTAAIAPLPVPIVIYADNPLRFFDDPRSGILAYGVCLCVGLVCSFCTWILFLVAVYNVLKFDLTAGQHKMLIQISGLGLNLATFLVFTISFFSISALSDKFYWLTISLYAACLAACIHLYKLPNIIYDQENQTT